MKLIIIAMFTLLIIPCTTAVYFSEIMYNPSGSDSGREWIELYTIECINLTAYRLFEAETNHNIYAYTPDNPEEIFCETTILADDPEKFLTDYPEYNGSIFRSSFSLNNAGEYLAIKKGPDIINGIDYSLILQQINLSEGDSLSYNFTSSEWFSGISTPGKAYDDAWEHAKNDTINATMNLSIENDTINVTGNLSVNASINITANFTENISDNINNTLNSTNLTLEAIHTGNDTCTAYITVEIKNMSETYPNNEAIKFYNKIYINATNISLKDMNYSIEYWVEDLFGNILKNKILTNNQNEKSYTPSIAEKDYIAIIRNSIKDIPCNMTDDSDSMMLIIKNDKPAVQNVDKNVKSSKAENDCPRPIRCEPVITNICNATKEPKAIDQGTVVKNSTAHAIQDIQKEFPKEKNFTDNTMTGAVVYTSRAEQNKLYGLIGMLLACAAGAGAFIYKRFHPKNVSEATLLSNDRFIKKD